MRSPLCLHLQYFFTSRPTLWTRLVRRLTCPHTYYVKRDAYHEERRGHYDEYICTRHVMVFQCRACGKRRRVARVLEDSGVAAVRDRA